MSLTYSDIVRYCSIMLSRRKDVITMSRFQTQTLGTKNLSSYSINYSKEWFDYCYVHRLRLTRLAYIFLHIISTTEFSFLVSYLLQKVIPLAF